MDLVELERMAQNVVDCADEPTEAEAIRWQAIFGFASLADATAAIEAHRADIARTRAPNELWVAVGPEIADQGWDREYTSILCTIIQQTANLSPQAAISFSNWVALSTQFKQSNETWS